MVFYGTPLQEELKKKLYTNPYLSIFNPYYGGTGTMMPWLNSIPPAKAGQAM